MLHLSVVVPARDSPDILSSCLDALVASDLPRSQWELIVVDDAGSADLTPIAAGKADHLIRLSPRSKGPAYARNRGAELATAPIVAFVDADVEVHPDALSRMRDALGVPGSPAAVFGAYDDEPRGEGLVSQYRNLLHHYVHKHSAGDVESFWAGCGAIRRDALIEVGMFDEVRYHRPEMEDVELGYRLRDAGHRIVLDPNILASHRKRWTIRSMISSDFLRRGVPWTRLLVERGMLLRPTGLSLGPSERASVFLAASFAALLIVAAILRNRALGLAALFVLLLFVLANRRLFAWLSRIRGTWFATRAVFLHLLYNLVAVSAVGWGLLLSLVGPRREERPRPVSQRSSRANPL